MALGTNPSFSQVKAFFTGSNNLSDYYRGGPYVPNIPANAGISTTAAGLQLSQFSGADKVTALPLSVSANDVVVQTAAGAPQASGTSNAVATGGTGNYTYTWTRISGETIHVGALTGSSLTFRITSGYKEANYRVTVSDGVSTVSRDILVQLTIGQPI